MQKVIFQLETLTCPSCMAKIQTALQKTKGVLEAEVLFNSSRARVTFDEEQISSKDLIAVIEKLGFKVIGEK
ncbi:MAG TPA: heavy-metal-associated domain-containing protein [Bacilli bacterium]|nr:heavy-metal-associated domain-containing protein [Bacilli bacterium]